MPKRLKAALNYNEKKVDKGRANCLHAANYLRDGRAMTFYQKLSGLQRLASLNERATTKTLHVSLNFDPSEKLGDAKLVAIAALYMEKIGFGEQPYLVYKHEDAGHPHIHIVSTTIQKDGSRINTHNIGRNQSEKARKEIEKGFRLIPAEKQKQTNTSTIKPIDTKKVIYGTAETKQSISNIVSAVYHHYQFTSLPEFNAALKQFGVVADRGKEAGRIYTNRGLVYRVIDDEGNKVGVPIKASSIGCKPTLANLEKKFTANESAKKAEGLVVKAKLEECMTNSPASVNELVMLLQQKNVYTVLRQTTEGRLYGITFVDNENKTVFNGSDLGKGYSAAAIQSKLVSGTANKGLKSENEKETTAPGLASQRPADIKQKSKDNNLSTSKDNPLEILLAKEQASHLPYSLLQKKRKKKRRNPNT